jgi:hypothetical protein
VSTCLGAPAPHLNCPHGDACDWMIVGEQGGANLRGLLNREDPDTLAELRTMAADGIGIVERGRQWLRGRQTRTPGRALATIEKLETADTTELGVPVFVWPAERGRVTGHAVGCEEHGPMPFLAPTRGKAIIAAARHVKYEHDSAGSVVLVPRAPRIKVKGPAAEIRA